jgi:hypothetical protein
VSLVGRLQGNAEIIHYYIQVQLKIIVLPDIIIILEAIDCLVGILQMKFGIAIGSNLGRRSSPIPLVCRGSLDLFLVVRWFCFMFSLFVWFTTIFNRFLAIL